MGRGGSNLSTPYIYYNNNSKITIGMSQHFMSKTYLILLHLDGKFLDK